MTSFAAWFRRSAKLRGESAIVAVLVAAAASLLVFTATRASVYTIDSYFYLAKARSLVTGRGFHVPWNDGVDRKFFWGYSIALALPLALFGDHGFVVLAALLHVALGVSFFRLLRLIEPRAIVRVIAVALLVFDPLLLWWSSVPASEPLFTLLAVEAVRRAVLARRSRGHATSDALLAALFAGLATATRAEGVFLVPVLLAVAVPPVWRARRFALLALCASLYVIPEAAHVLYLSTHAPATHASSEYFDEWLGHLHDIEWETVAWENLRAPFWTIYRHDTDRTEYLAHFPLWLVHTQAYVSRAYLWALAIVFLGGLRRRSPAFWAAVGIGVYAGIHAVWYYRYERFMTVTTPFAALVFASAGATVADAIGAITTHLRVAIVPAAIAVAGICAVYAIHLCEMHADRLDRREGARDYPAAAERIARLDPVDRPIASDLGPYLAYFEPERTSLLVGDEDFYEDAVPRCIEGRELLAARNAAFFVGREDATTLADRYDLSPADYDLVGGAPTLLALHVQPHREREDDVDLVRDYPRAPTFGEKIALDRAEVTGRRTARCGDLRVDLRLTRLARAALGDEIFVHVDDVDHPATRLDVARGDRTDLGGGHFEESFVVHVPSERALQRVHVWVGLWNAYDGRRATLSNGRGERVDADRLLVAEASITPP